jgi:hypothetical protein
MKQQYRSRNWSEYNAGLKQRGSLTFWVDEAVLAQWIIRDLSGQPIAFRYYSDLAISTPSDSFDCPFTDAELSFQD